MKLAVFLPLLFVRMSLFALWNASPSRQTQREDYNSENVIDLLEALNVTRGGVKGVSKVKGQEAGLVAWRFRSRTPHLVLPREHTLYLLSSAHGSLGLHLIGQQARQSTATFLSLMSRGQLLLRLISCTRTDKLRLEYPTEHQQRSSSDTPNIHSLTLPGGSPFTRGGWVQMALGLEPKRVTLYTSCSEEVVVELSQPDEVINLLLPVDLQVVFASEPEDANSKFSGSWQTAEISTRVYQRRPWSCPNITEPLPPPTVRTETPQTSSPTMLLDDRVGVANDQPQRVVLGAPARKGQSPTRVPVEAPSNAHSSHGERISRLEEHLDGVQTMLDMLKNQNVELTERVRFLETCECVRRVCVWEGVEVESGKIWETDTHTTCTCTNGEVHCSAAVKDPCLSAPCLNGGVCQAVTSDPQSFTCSCPPSAEGRLCERPRSPLSSQACFMPVLRGKCHDWVEPVQRWFYNPTSSSCENFLFSGCHGNDNNFLTSQACEEQCVMGACCYRHGDNKSSSSNPDPTARFPEWATPNLNMSLETWLCDSGPIACEHMSMSQCQGLSTAASFSPGRLCAAVGCATPPRNECLCVFNGRTFRPGEAFDVGCEACVCTYQGVVECTCRSPQPRKELRDLSQSELREYHHAVRQLYRQPDGWLEFTRLRAEFAPQANGWGTFLSWHRYFLWSVERALRNASWCGVSIPYLEWTVDAGAPESSVAWQANVLGGDGDQHTECVWLHPFQPPSSPGQQQRWSPCLRRRFNASVSLPDAVTMQLITMETDFLKFSARLQAASGLFLLWVGGHMATPFCAYDPAFLSHAAFVDRLWELWQERRAAADVMAGTTSTTSSSSSGGLPGPDWYPEKLRFARLEPFGVSLEDMSSQRLCTVYIPISLGSPCNHMNPHTHHTHAANNDHSSHPHMSHTTVVGEGEAEERVFDRRGFDAEGYDRSGYDIMGWDRHGYARDNYNRDHVDRQGYDSFGFDRYGFTRANLTSFGLRRNGKLLLPALGNRLMDQLFPDGFNRYGYSPLGLDRRGFDAFGFSKEGVDQDGCNFFFGGPHYLRFYFHALLNMSLLPPRTLAHTPRICPPISPLPSYWVSQNWVGVGSDEQEESWSTLIGALVEEWANQRPFQQDYNPNVSPVKKNGLWLPLTPDLRFCFAWQWYSGCPFGSALMTCPDLCQSAHCRGQPRAVCRMITCECVYDGKTYKTGEEFKPDCCATCVCQNGQMNCIRETCLTLSCREQYVPDGECCPVCKSGCKYGERWYENGVVFVSEANPCLNCSCTNNQVKCASIQCEPPRCKNPFNPPGECCPTCTACDLDGRPFNNTPIISTLDGCQTCTCQNGAVSCDAIQRCTKRCVDDGLCCRHQPGLVLLDGVAFPDPRDSCRHCVCTEGHVVCTGVSCPPLDCALVETVGGVCCPRCRSCVLDGIWHEHGSQWSHSNDPCSVCTCLEGQVHCETQDCGPPCPYPSSPRPGTCCPVCNGCGVNGLDFLNGDRVPNGDRCEECVCVSGDLHCKPLPCPATPCPRPIKRPGECCPRCEQCEYESQVYADGQSIPSRRDPCVSCRCSAGEVLCDRLDSQCPDVRCTHPTKPQGQCCGSCEMCEYERRVYADGKVFRPPGSGPCVECTCKRGSVRCHKERCPPVPCTNPIRDPQLCCPVCKVCLLDGVELEEGSEWEVECNRCVCEDGEVVCRSAHCPPVTCQHPSKTNGDCCAACDRCSYNNRIYENGQTFTDPDNPCQRCFCQDGTMQCSGIECPQLKCSNPYKPPGQCCAQCPDCNFENRVFVSGEQFPNPLQPCEDCVCVDGRVECNAHQCPAPNCHHPLPASCCQNNCNGCSYAGKEYPNGAEFPHPTDKCRHCHCINGNVQCLMKRCPAVQCLEPHRVPGECCPQCPAPPANCVYLGHSYQHTQRFYHPTDSCQSCSCSNGTVSCVRKPCPLANCVHPIHQDCCSTCDGCQYDGREHPNGGVFPDLSDPCGVCVCRGGTVKCERKRCPLITCPFPIQRECCQSCDGCLYAGVEYQSGQEFVDPASSCGVCVCVNGRVTCNPKPCYNPGCTHPVTVPGQCCPVCDGCLYDNAVLLSGQVFPDARNPCSECSCREGTVTCSRRACPTATCPHPVPGPCDCPVCEGCHFQGEVYVDGQSFSAPKANCDVCTCSQGRVTCSTRACEKVTCSHPALDVCSCGTCEGCLFHQRYCGNGERFPHPQDPCQRCTCLNGGVTCVPPTCPSLTCSRPVRPPGECCPVCTGVCQHLGRVHDSGTTFTHPNDRCSTCTCINEVVTCQRKTCAKQCTHPVRTRDCCPVCEGCVYDGQEYTHKHTFTPRGRPCDRCVCVSGSVTCSPRTCPVLSCSNPHTPPGQCCPECRVCSQNGVEFMEGQTWNPKNDPCQKCTCAFGEVVCVGPQCPALTCTSQLTDPDSCCPRCKGCMYKGVDHEEGSEWFDSGSPCMSCMCVGGVTTCSELRCLSPCTHTISVPGECCPVCADCIYDGKVYGPGDTFNPAGDPCQICVCEVMPDGEQHLRCVRKQCPSLVDCPKENILFASDACCPVCAQPLSNCTATLIGNEVLATDDPCFTCQCKDLTWTCIHQSCVPLTCPPKEQYMPPDSCCAVCDECLIEGGRDRVSNGHSWTDGSNECITCTCNLGYIECEIEECVPLVCSDGWVTIKPPGKCCHECQDSGRSCEYQGEVFGSNEHWEVDECTSCTCVSGDVHCQTERCPPSNCAADETPALIPGMCCPHCLPRPATCIAFGDPHYRTFDGRMVNFQGSCTYVLTEDCHGGDFSIHVTNDARGRKGVSWTKEVTLFIADITVTLQQNWVVMVDSKVVSLPYLKEPYVYVERKTNTILLNTNIGLKVQWNGRSHLEVSVPGTYKKHTCGLCGNFNNFPQDDLKLRNGQVISSEAAFGNNWRVDSLNGSVCALEAEDVNPCKSAGYSARKSANARCAVLKGSMFERCHKVVPPEMFFAACVYDLCACGANSEECLCDALEAYASECREAGVILQWRSTSLCAVGCPVDRGFVFDECGPPCAVTCVTRDVPLGVIEAQCFKPCVPGCQCPAGRVLHDNHCIRPTKCPNIIHNTT